MTPGPKREWWETFFGPDYLLMYHFDPKRTRREVDGALAVLGVSPPGTVLDLCCGHGRHAVELARRGYEVTGLDTSEFLLREAKKAARKRKVAVEWVRGDMRDIPFRNRFDAVVNLFTSFGYFRTKAEDLAVLRGVRRALKPNGLFLIDTLNRRPAYERDFQRRDWREVRPGTFLLEENHCHAAKGLLSVRRILVTPERRRTYHFRLRLYTKGDLESLLRRAGLAPVGWFGGLDGRPFEADSHRMVALARKPPRPRRAKAKG